MAKKPTNEKRQKPEVAVATVTRCPACGSTEREAYSGVVTKELPGIDPQTGGAYTHVIWRRTACRDCGQHRIDRHRENRPASKKRSA